MRELFSVKFLYISHLWSTWSAVSHLPHAQGRGAKKRTQRAGRFPFVSTPDRVTFFFVQVGTLSSSHPSFGLSVFFLSFFKSLCGGFLFSFFFFPARWVRFLAPRPWM